MARTRFRTFTGLMVDPFDMNEGDIRIADIARSQTLSNRYNGHTNFPYSVAQHSIMLAHYVPGALFQQGLIRTSYEGIMAAKAAFAHDWSETYVQDIITPIKHRLAVEGRSFVEFEEGIQRLIFHKFKIDWDFMELIVPFDKRIYEDEAPVLKPLHERSGLMPLGIVIEEWPDWRQTEQTFYQLYNQLEFEHEAQH